MEAIHGSRNRSDAQPAIDALRKVAHDDPNELVRDMAAQVLRDIGD